MHIERQVSSILKENKQDKDGCVLRWEINQVCPFPSVIFFSFIPIHFDFMVCHAKILNSLAFCPFIAPPWQVANQQPRT